MSGIRVNYSGLIAFVTAIVSLAIGLMYMIIITRNLSPYEFGTWNLIQGLVAYGIVLNPIVSFWATREIARGDVSGKTILIGTEILAIGGIFIYFLTAFFLQENSDADFFILALGLILIPLRYLNISLNAIHTGWKPQLVSYSKLFGEISKVPLALFFVYFLDMSVSGIVLTFAISLLVSSLIQIIYGCKKISGKILKLFFKKWLKLSWLPLYPSIGGILNRSDVIIFSLITGSVSGLAFFATSLIIANIVTSASKISGTVYSKLLEVNNTGYITENLRIHFYFAIPIVAISIVFARPALYVLNPIYVDAYFVVLFLCLRSFLWNLNVNLGRFLTGVEKVDIDSNATFKDYMKSKLFTIPTIRIIQYGGYVLTLIVVLSVFQENDSQLKLVEYWAFVVLVTEIPMSIYFWRKVHQNIDLQIDFFNIGKYVITSVAIFVTIFFLLNANLTYEKNIFVFLPSLIPYLLLGITFYLGITYIIDKKTRKLIFTIVKELKS